VMGFSHPNSSDLGGPAAARELYTYLAHHPSTATFLATKLARHFVADTPPATLVAKLAKVYLANDTRIGPVLRALFSSAEFGASAGMKLRRPMDHLVATARAVGLRPGTDPKALLALTYSLDRPGHMPFRWPTPDGYPDTAAAWQSAGQALSQFTTSNALLRGHGPQGFGYTKPGELLTDPAAATTAGAITAQLAMRFFGRAPSAGETRSVLTILSGASYPRTFAAGSGAQNEAVAVAAVLLFHSPAFLTR